MAKSNDKTHQKRMDKNCHIHDIKRKVIEETLFNKDNSSIPLFEIHKSIEEKTNPGYKHKLRVTHQI